MVATGYGVLHRMTWEGKLVGAMSIHLDQLAFGNDTFASTRGVLPLDTPIPPCDPPILPLPLLPFLSPSLLLSFPSSLLPFFSPSLPLSFPSSLLPFFSPSLPLSFPSSLLPFFSPSLPLSFPSSLLPSYFISLPPSPPALQSLTVV